LPAEGNQRSLEKWPWGPGTGNAQMSVEHLVMPESFKTKRLTVLFKNVKVTKAKTAGHSRLSEIKDTREPNTMLDPAWLLELIFFSFLFFFFFFLKK
jgi:hypothetical protein